MKRSIDINSEKVDLDPILPPNVSIAIGDWRRVFIMGVNALGLALSSPALAEPISTEEAEAKLLPYVRSETNPSRGTAISGLSNTPGKSILYKEAFTPDTLENRVSSGFFYFIQTCSVDEDNTDSGKFKRYKKWNFHVSDDRPGSVHIWTDEVVEDVYGNSILRIAHTAADGEEIAKYCTQISPPLPESVQDEQVEIRMDPEVVGYDFDGVFYHTPPSLLEGPQRSFSSYGFPKSTSHIRSLQINREPLIEETASEVSSAFGFEDSILRQVIYFQDLDGYVGAIVSNHSLAGTMSVNNKLLFKKGDSFKRSIGHELIHLVERESGLSFSKDPRIIAMFWDLEALFVQDFTDYPIHSLRPAEITAEFFSKLLYPELDFEKKIQDRKYREMLLDMARTYREVLTDHIKWRGKRHNRNNLKHAPGVMVKLDNLIQELESMED